MFLPLFISALFFLSSPPCAPSNHTAAAPISLSDSTPPRWRVSDTRLHKPPHATAARRYVFFPGKPRWTRKMPMVLTYAFLTENWISNLSVKDVKSVFRRAFSKWAHAIPVSFEETEEYGYADIKIGFYSGDHSDGQPFDGELGVLAHSFSPEIGRLHLDAAETWAVDFELEKSAVAVDLESVATHEIGHLLGLGHSRVRESVMYPSLKPREKKSSLGVDDVEGVRALYGFNPSFKFESRTSSFATAASRASVSTCTTTWHLAILFFFFTSHFVVKILPIF